jgi:hypothetical protein
MDTRRVIAAPQHRRHMRLSQFRAILRGSLGHGCLKASIALWMRAVAAMHGRVAARTLEFVPDLQKNISVTHGQRCQCHCQPDAAM